MKLHLYKPNFHLSKGSQLKQVDELFDVLFRFFFYNSGYPLFGF